MATEKLTVVTAHGGTEALGGNSIVGHIYYILTDSNGDQNSYGFSLKFSECSREFIMG